MSGSPEAELSSQEELWSKMAAGEGSKVQVNASGLGQKSRACQTWQTVPNLILIFYRCTLPAFLHQCKSNEFTAATSPHTKSQLGMNDDHFREQKTIDIWPGRNHLYPLHKTRHERLMYNCNLLTQNATVKRRQHLNTALPCEGWQRSLQCIFKCPPSLPPHHIAQHLPPSLASTSLGGKLHKLIWGK